MRLGVEKVLAGTEAVEEALSHVVDTESRTMVDNMVGKKRVVN